MMTNLKDAIEGWLDVANSCKSNYYKDAERLSAIAISNSPARSLDRPQRDRQRALI